MKTSKRIRLATLAIVLTLFVGGYSSAQGIFGDDTSDLADDGLGFGETADSSSGFDDTAVPDQAAIQEQMTTAMQEIQSLQEAGDWAGALEKISTLATSYRLPPSFTFEAGRCYAALGNDSLAISNFSDVIVSSGAFSQPQLLSLAFVARGELLLKGSNYSEAIDDFNEGVQNSPQNPRAHYFLGRGNLLQVMTSPGQGRDQAGMAGLRGAMTSLTKAIELNPDYGEAYLDRGRVLLRLRQIKYAIEDHEKAVQILGDKSNAVADLALSYRSSGQAEAAKKDLDQSKIIADYRKSLRSMDSYLSSHSINEARKPWDDPDPLDFQPHSILMARAETKIYMGDELRSNDSYEDAIKDCDTFLRLEHIGPSEKAQGHYTRGLALRMLNRFDEAVDDLTKAIDQSKQSAQPGYPEASLRRGIIYFRQGNYDLAIGDFDDAANANPFQTEPRAMLWRGLAFAKKGELHEATRSYTKAIMTYREFVPAYINRGLAHMKTGRYKDAYDDFSTAVRLDGDNEQAKTYRDAAERNRDNSLSLSSY